MTILANVKTYFCRKKTYPEKGYYMYMDHVAIMNKEGSFFEKIQNGKKTVESRWYITKRAPWDKVAKGDTVYFKKTGSLISLAATVSEVKQFSHLSPGSMRKIIEQYGVLIGLEKEDFTYFYEKYENKRYCILIFLKDVHSVKPFRINKKGFGAMTAWISTPTIASIKLTDHLF